MADPREKKRKEEIKEIVLARLETLPNDASISIGSMGSFSKDQLIEAVKEDTEVGKKITEIQLEYLQLLKEGIFYGNTSNG